ncbi:MAG: tRNA lysidine(34) synthetase TilS [Verrucomicrobia bacterium]|nr:tRNA lysidine(34) synthetase TilS [Verrucomicrobiota bacterium]
MKRDSRRSPSNDPVVQAMLDCWKGLSASLEEPQVVAVSGGMDSVVLANAMVEAWRREGGDPSKLHLAHFNHRLRGDESDRDEGFCRKEAARLGIRFHLGGPAPFDRRASGGVSVEMWARKERHRFLARVARSVQAKHVLLAHHADDQLELHLMRLARGTAGWGASGMREWGPSAEDSAVVLARPFLGLSRAELEAWAKSRRLLWVEDSSNAHVTIPRNRIRSEVLPVWAKAEPGSLAARAGRVLRVMGDESEFVRQRAREWLREPDAIFEDLPPALQRQVMVLEFERLQMNPTLEDVEFLRTRARVRRSLRGEGHVIRTPRGRLQFLPALREYSRSLTLGKGKGRGSAGAFQFTWHTLEGEEAEALLKLPFIPGEERMDLDRCGEGWILRNWRMGDCMCPLGMKGRKKLHDIWVDRKFPRWQREGAAVLVGLGGEVVWAEGAGISDRVKIRPGTRRLLVWKGSRTVGDVFETP